LPFERVELNLYVTGGRHSRPFKKDPLQSALRRCLRKSTHWTRHLASRYSNVGSTVVSPVTNKAVNFFRRERFYHIRAEAGQEVSQVLNQGRGLLRCLYSILKNAVEHFAALGASAAKLTVSLTLAVLYLMEFVSDMKGCEDSDL